MNPNDYDEKKDEFFKKYKDTPFDDKLAKKSNYAILSGDNHSIIIEAIGRVQQKLNVQYQKFINSNKFKKSDEDQKAYKQAPTEYQIVLVTVILRNLLREDGYLIEKLGEKEEEKLYKDFYIHDDEGFFYDYNKINTLWLYFLSYLAKIHEPHKLIIRKNFLFDANYARLIVGKKALGPVMTTTNGKQLITQEALQEFNNYSHISKYAKMPYDDLILFIQILNLAYSKINDGGIKESDGRIKVEMSLYDTLKYFSLTGEKLKYYDKKKIFKKIWEKQKTLSIDLLDIIGNRFNMKNRRLYEIDIDGVINNKMMTLPSNETRCSFFIDTHLIALSHEHYIYFSLDELKEIEKNREEYWVKISTERKNDKYRRLITKYVRPNTIFKGGPIRFNMLLKTMQNKQNGTNIYHVTDRNFNIGLGDIDGELLRILEENKYIGKKHGYKRDSESFKNIRELILKSIFTCAKNAEKKWIVSKPTFEQSKQIWTFKTNTYYYTGVYKR
jgi:hypothetical protein